MFRSSVTSPASHCSLSSPLKVVLPYRTCVIVATVLLGSAFGSENFMSGINTVGVGQVEAARSLGMSFSRIID